MDWKRTIVGNWLFGVFLALSVLSTPSEAEPLHLTVRSYPPGAELHDQFGGYLGKSGEPLNLDWDRSKGSLILKFSLDGHQTVTRTVTYMELQKPIYPEHEVVNLPPNSALIGLKNLLRYRPGWVLGPGAVLLALGVVIRRRRPAGSEAEPEAERIGEYELLEAVGRGGMATVYRAVSTSDPDRMEVALKLMGDLTHLGEAAVERFRREIRASVELDHPHLLQVFNYGEHSDGRPYLVTELLEGMSLQKRLRQCKGHPLPDQLVVQVLEQVGAALSYLHQQGVVHRDVKPDNIFLTRSGRIVLMDLGIARGHEMAPLTATGAAMGTPQYMAPEQIRGELTPKTDQFALGAVAFEMLTGRPPVSGKDAMEILNKQVHEIPPPITDFRPEATPFLEDTVGKILAKKPESRFPDIATAVDNLVEGITSIEGGKDTVVS